MCTAVESWKAALPAALLAALLIGCGEGEPADGQAQVAPDLRESADDNVNDDPQDVPVFPVNDPEANAGPDANAVHPIAGRSAFPEAGEDLTDPIPAERLSELDQFGQAIDPEDIPDLVPWEQAGQYVGYEITVAGRIVSTGQSRDGNVNFLNFHQDWRGKFYMVIFEDLADTLDGTVDAVFRGRTVHVTGEVEDHRGRPQIRILSMDQVRFVDE